MLKINDKRIFITHGIYTIKDIGFKHESEIITIRNTTNYLPLPLKFKEILREYYFRWFHVKKNLKWFNKRIKIGMLIDGHIQFTIAHEPLLDVMTITLCHPYKDQFERREGVKWVKGRMEYALRNINDKVWWKYNLER